MSTSGKISLYFHIPFCLRKCPYCHFYSLAYDKTLAKEFMQALYLEWQQKRPQIQKQQIVSIYFGGGTPSLLQTESIEKILSWIKKDCKIERQCEITIEANPDTVSLEYIQNLHDLSINRISMGVQSLDSKLLQVLGRSHTKEKAIDAACTIKKGGINNLSIDLMIDIPHQTIDHLQSTFKEVSSLPIDHVSLYNLVFEEKTPFFYRKKELLPFVAKEAKSLEMLQYAIEQLSVMGFNRYEISAFAKDNKASRHNSGYWTGRPFFGFGPSAFSYWENSRFSNISSLKEYMQRLNIGQSPVDFSEKLSFIKQLRELLVIQLRMIEGIDLARFEKSYGAIDQPLLKQIEKMVSQKLLIQNNNRLKLSEKGLLLYDEVASYLI